MTSKLFHTVVGFGISLGALSMGCAAEAPETASDAAEISTYGAATEPTKAEPTKTVTDPAKDRFCEIPWPTTKGAPRPTPADAQACVDPLAACGEYPKDQWGGFDACTPAADVNSCTFTERSTWMICKTTSATASAWACPAGSVRESACVFPEEPEPEASR